jgi:hypothetical protein
MAAAHSGFLIRCQIVSRMDLSQDLHIGERDSEELCFRAARKVL